MNSILAILFWLLLIASVGYAFWRGRRYEKMSALICLLATVVSLGGRLLMRRYDPIIYSGVESSDLIVDTLVLAAFVFIALRSDRFWPLWVAGLQLPISMAHLFKAIQPDLLPTAYGAAERFWSYPTLLIILIASWRQHRRMLAQPEHTALT